MQTKPIIGVVLCFGIAFAMLGGSGVGAAVFGEAPGDHQTTRALDEIAGDSELDQEEGDPGGLSAEVAGDSEPTLVGVAISGGQFAASLVGAVALLPVTLIQLGFPSWFAVPIGGAAQIIALIGLVQFIRGTEYL